MASNTPIRKVLIHTFGGPEVVSVVDGTVPPPAAGEVQVAPVYSGFNGADPNMRRGTYPLQRKAPLTPGYSLVGRVVKHQGSKKTDPKFQPGALVACMSVYGSEATLVNLPEKYVIPVPEGLDIARATALVVDWATAYGMVYDVVQIVRGQRVFIHGLSGAVGNALLQLCRRQGAEVYGTASIRNHEALGNQGATPFVYTDKNWIADMKKLGGAHVVFDALGFESWDESYSILSDSDNSILVGYGGNQDSLNGKGANRSVVGPTIKLFARGAKFWEKRKTCFYYITRDQATYGPNLKTLFQLVRDNQIDVLIKKVWDMEDVQEAHRSWGSGQGMGSYLLKVSEGNDKYLV